MITSSILLSFIIVQENFFHTMPLDGAQVLLLLTLHKKLEHIFKKLVSFHAVIFLLQSYY